MLFLKILLSVLLGIICLLALLLTLNLKLFLTLGDALTVRAGVGPVVLTLVPKKKKPVKLSDYTYQKVKKRQDRERLKSERKRTKAAARAAKKKEAEDLTKKAEAAAETGDASGKLHAILGLIGFVLDELPRFASYIHTDIRTLSVTVGGEDAAAIALNYGKIAGAVSLLLALLREKTALRERGDAVIGVEPDFLSEKTVLRLDIAFRLRLFSIVRVGWHFLVHIIRAKIRESEAAL